MMTNEMMLILAAVILWGAMPKRDVRWAECGLVGHAGVRETSMGTCMVGEPSDSPPDLSEPMPGISVAVGLAYCDHRTALYVRVLRQFFEGKSADGPRLRVALKVGDFEAARKIAHGFKSTAGAVGAVQLSAASAALELALREGSLIALPALEEVFFAEFDVVFAHWPRVVLSP
jgi:HPt (histidine-containing phosphotransfer) domain-containing protein